MRTLSLSLSLTLILALSALGQSFSEIIATAAGKHFTPASLSADGQKRYSRQRNDLANQRTKLLNTMMHEIVLDLEAKAAATTTEQLLAAVTAKVPTPTPTELQAIYNANASEFPGRSFSEVRGDLTRYVKQSREDKAIEDYLKSLKRKHRATPGKDVNMTGLGAADVLVTINGRPITVRDFETNNRATLNDFERNIYEDLRSDLKASMLSVLITEEAKARGVEPSSVYAADVTDKLRSYTEQEKFDLENDLQKRLFTKYSAKILLTEPERYMQTVSVDDDPTTGPTNAPVTIVMFSDFQCPACAAAHPILKSVAAEFPGKVRIAVRDYPLTTIHVNAFRAALAANAARVQGKFFEYAEILYANQTKLDDASLKRYASGLGLNLKQFELDLNDAKTAAEVRKDMAEAAVYGVSWTPTIYVNGIKVMRPGSDDLREAISRALGK